MKLAFLTTTVATANDATFKLRTVSLEEAREIAKSADETQSYIRHSATAKVMAAILGVEVPLGETQLKQEVGQQALVFKLRTRLGERQVLTTEKELDEVGYDFVLMTRTA